MASNRTVKMHSGATAAALGAIAESDGLIEHSFEVLVTGTGAISVTIEPRWSNSDAQAGAGNLISTAQTVSGTGVASQTFTARGSSRWTSCRITAISGTNAAATVVYHGVG